MIFLTSVLKRSSLTLIIWFLTLSPVWANSPNYAHAKVVTHSGIEIPVEISDTVEKRSLGLGKRDQLQTDWGMLFVFEKRAKHTFWMKDMRFPIDIIWLDNHKIIHILSNVKPEEPGVRLPKLKPAGVANFVLEIEAGKSKLLNLQVGQRVQYKF